MCVRLLNEMQDFAFDIVVIVDIFLKKRVDVFFAAVKLLFYVVP